MKKYEEYNKNIKIKRRIIDTVIGISRKVYPDEFIGLLRKNKKREISTLLILPKSIYGKGFSSIRFDLVPNLLDYCGSVHSHPGISNKPSEKDIEFFSRVGDINIIIAYPFREESIEIYNNKGEIVKFEIVG